MYNTSPKYKSETTYSDFMPKQYSEKYKGISDKLPSSTPEKTRDWVERHNKNFPDSPIYFDYDKFKTVN